MRALTRTYFPYDVQTCSFLFSTLESQSSACLAAGTNVGKIKGFIENGEWDVLDISARDKLVGYTFCAVYVDIKLKRRPTYYTLNIFLPVVAISLLGQFTFMVPFESGERLAYSLTVLLSQSVYATSVSSLMPRSSLTTPVIIRYMQSLFIISSLSIFINLLIITLRWGKIIVREDIDAKTFHAFGIPFTVTTRNKSVGNVNRIGIEETINNSSRLQPRKDANFNHNAISTDFQVYQNPQNSRLPEHKDAIKDLQILSPPHQTYRRDDTHMTSIAPAYTGIESFTNATPSEEDYDADLKRVLHNANASSFAFLFFCFTVMTIYTFSAMNVQNE